MTNKTFFTGREEELTLLCGLLDDAQAGETRVAALSGEPGIGKTRTAMELSGAAKARDFAVFWAYCYGEHESPPHWPWIQILRSCCDVFGHARTPSIEGEA